MQQDLLVLKEIDSARLWSRDHRHLGRRVALVPTMGYLHEGHLSLIRLAAAQADAVIVSIFVNPTQFGPTEDYERYPRDLKRDLSCCRSAGAHAVFCPSREEIYPFVPTVGIVEDAVSQSLEGAARPGHFRGVLTVVGKLFLITEPNVAVFGQKDAQQLFLIRKMVHDLNFAVDILEGPTVREPDGLAMSSRNTYLSETIRAQASCLYRALSRAQELARAGEENAYVIRDAMRAVIEAEPDAGLDYAEVVQADTFAPVTTVHGDCIALAAVRFGSVRLIDNMSL